MNKRYIDDKLIAFINDKSGALQPSLTPTQLRQWGIRVDAYAELAKLPVDEPLEKPLGDYIPFAAIKFEFNTMTLFISMPQAAIDEHYGDMAAELMWNDGVPVLFTNYAFSGSERTGASRPAIPVNILTCKAAPISAAGDYATIQRGIVPMRRKRGKPSIPGCNTTFVL